MTTRALVRCWASVRCSKRRRGGVHRRQLAVERRRGRGLKAGVGGEKRRAKSLRIGVHHANAVVWEPVYRTRLFRRGDSPSKRVSNVRQLAPRLETDRQRPRLSPSLDALRAPQSRVDGRRSRRATRRTRAIGAPGARRRLPLSRARVSRTSRASLASRRASVSAARSLAISSSWYRADASAVVAAMSASVAVASSAATARSKPRGLFVLLRRVSVTSGWS